MKKSGKSKKGENKKKKENKVEKEIVYVDINDILEMAKIEVIMSHGGIGVMDVEYAGEIDKLAFTIPKTNREGKCDEILSPEIHGEFGEIEGCGETGGSCICGEDEGHEGDHKCELCGEEW